MSQDQDRAIHPTGRLPNWNTRGHILMCHPGDCNCPCECHLLPEMVEDPKDATAKKDPSNIEWVRFVEPWEKSIIDFWRRN